MGDFSQQLQQLSRRESLSKFASACQTMCSDNIRKAETIRESVEKKLEEGASEARSHESLQLTGFAVQSQGLLEKVNMDLISKMDAVMDHLSQTQAEA